MNELVSIVVPIYNVEKYLSKCIDSLIDQTYKNLEIILVNDGSTDQSGDIAQQYAKQDSRIRYIIQKNKGLGGARNTGLEYAKGNYILFIDSDDYIRNNMVEKMVKAMEANALDIVVCEYERVNEKGEYIERYHLPFLDHKVYDPLHQKEVLLMDPAAWNKMYKRELFEHTNLRFPDRVWYEDLRTTPKLIAQAKRVGFLHEPFYLYLQRASSIMNSTTLSRQAESLQAMDDLIHYFKANHLYKTYEKELEFLCIAHVYVFGINRVARIPHSKAMTQKFKEYTVENFPNFHSNPYFSLFTPKEKKFYKWIDHNQIWKIQLGDKVKKEVKKWKKH
ncbi:glycosyltransferase family 2 protein [uncultured Dubosiella sp.]|uniref:glycosyltransferase family 2 protein n=1 Tax=uncultured Dubosiella sp. TaxID=1937011 RepID=UPI0025B3749F|nr:glycosyltransferase family 2 protein [uncultured Dubosiella sp.]